MYRNLLATLLALLQRRVTGVEQVCFAPLTRPGPVEGSNDVHEAGPRGRAQVELVEH